MFPNSKNINFNSEFLQFQYSQNTLRKKKAKIASNKYEAMKKIFSKELQKVCIVDQLVWIIEKKKKFLQMNFK